LRACFDKLGMSRFCVLGSRKIPLSLSLSKAARGAGRYRDP
jgi:hypothetical protein